MAKAQEALKLFYLPGLRYQLNTANPILSVVERDRESVVGSEIRMALRYGRQGGVGNRADDGILPVPNSRKTKQAAWVTKNIFARIHISDKTMRASRGSDGAFVSLLEAELEDAQSDVKDMMARQVYGDGVGTMATFGANAATTTLTVDSTQYFADGQFIDIVDNGGTVLNTGLEILGVDDVNLTIEVDQAVTTANTDIAVISGNYDTELTGFGAVFEMDNTLYGIDRSTNKWFNPSVFDHSGEITEVAIQAAIDTCDKKAGGRINFLNSSYGVRRAYQNLLLATKRTTDVMQLKGGYSVLTYNGHPFSVDKYAPEGTLFGMDLDTWRLYHIMDWDWLSEDGAVLHRVSDRAVWEATLARYCDLGCSKPKGNFKMYNIVEH